MEPIAIASMLVGLAITWGGAAICLRIAIKRDS
ncbi:MAG: MetS family NSS transporter small subunit [Desulfovibrionaceae bacterium]|jgi:hypothetical protein|nr:MetS family NSS transporter small subunit [Desulfovibrionaceae bacterium]